MNQPKRHHFVPIMLQAHFTNSDGSLFFYDRNRPEDGIKSTKPENLFVKKHFYSLKSETGEKDPELETRLSRLEGSASQLILRIEDAVLDGKPPKLSADEKELWDLFFYVQWKRTPDNLESLETVQNFDVTLANAISDFENTHRTLTDEERKNFGKPEAINRLKHNASVKAVGASSPDVIGELAEKGIVFAKIDNEKKHFIIGSNPVAKMTHPGRAHISDPTVEIWLPITPKIAVSPAYTRGTEKVISLSNTSDIRHINLAITNQSNVIASASQSLISSLINPR